MVFLFLCLSWFSSEKFLYINNEKAILNYRQRRLRLYNSGTKFVPFVKFLQKNLFSFTEDFVVLYAEHQWIGLLSRWSFPYNLSVEKQDLKRFGLVWFSLVWFKLQASSWSCLALFTNQKRASRSFRIRSVLELNWSLKERNNILLFALHWKNLILWFFCYEIKCNTNALFTPNRNDSHRLQAIYFTNIFQRINKIKFCCCYTTKTNLPANKNDLILVRFNREKFMLTDKYPMGTLLSTSRNGLGLGVR